MTPRPKTLLYRDALVAVEQRIVEALPEVVDGLIARAREGDTKAAVYLRTVSWGESPARRFHRPTTAERRTPKTPSCSTNRNRKRTMPRGDCSSVAVHTPEVNCVHYRSASYCRGSTCDDHELVDLKQRPSDQRNCACRKPLSVGLLRRISEHNLPPGCERLPSQNGLQEH
jgi:hypothetical protein